MKLIAFLSVIVAIVGCASSPEKIDAVYVSPMKYANYNCNQVNIERAHIERRTNELYHSLKKEADATRAVHGDSRAGRLHERLESLHLERNPASR